MDQSSLQHRRQHGCSTFGACTLCRLEKQSYVDVFNLRFLTQVPKVVLDYSFDLSRYLPNKKVLF